MFSPNSLYTTKQMKLADDGDRPQTRPQGQTPRKEGKRYVKPTARKGGAQFECCALVLSWILIVMFFPFSICCCVVTIAEFSRAIIFRLGRVREGARGPGLIWVMPCIDQLMIVDLRTRVEVIPSQDVITKDSVTISVDAVLFYCIEGSMHATIQISNVHESTIFIAQTTLRNMVGAMTLHELLTSRESLSKEIGIAVDHATEKWGVRIERVDIKDIALPEVLQRSLASEAEALREARAKIISAEGELSAATALKEASDVMLKNKICLQLRHLQILTSIAQERRVKIIYPFPLEMMSPFEGGGGGASGSGGRKKGGAASEAGLRSFFPIFGSQKEDIPAGGANSIDRSFNSGRAHSSGAFKLHAYYNMNKPEDNLPISGHKGEDSTAGGSDSIESSLNKEHSHSSGSLMTSLEDTPEPVLSESSASTI